MLDSKDVLRSVDQKDMLGTIEQLPKHLKDGLRWGRSAGLPRFAPRSILVCGMGGSAIGGDLLCEWLGQSTDVPCEVSRTYDLPNHIGRDSLVIVASYSGDTEETLSMFDGARRKRAKIVAVCSGGELARLAESASVPIAKIPTGLVPRATVGYMFGAMVGVIERSGIAFQEKQFEEAFRVIAHVAKFCAPSAPTGSNPAKKLAHELFHLIPLVIGHGLSGPIARRWAGQILENAKALAFHAELPELDHNAIVGLVSDSRSQGFGVVFLEHSPVSDAMRARIDATKAMVGEKAPVYSVDAHGLSPLAKMFSLLVIGDYTSVYLAILRNADPSVNEPIDRLKSILSKK